MHLLALAYEVIAQMRQDCGVTTEGADHTEQELGNLMLEARAPALLRTFLMLKASVLRRSCAYAAVLCIMHVGVGTG